MRDKRTNMKVINIIAFFLPLLILSSCKTLNSDVTYEQMLESASRESRSLRSTPDFRKCNPKIHTQFGDVRLNCNLWGYKKLKKGQPYNLCVYKKGDFWGWDWQLPNNAQGVIGYPALLVGRSPWSPKRKKIGGFPRLVSNVSTLSVSYDVETYVKHKKYNLAFDIWLLDEEFGEKKNIRTEIMIWEDYFDFTSYGKVGAVLETPFGEYKMHLGYLTNPKYDQDWNYIAFVRTEPRTSGSVDIAYLLNYLLDRNLISKEHYMSSFEFGNEIGNSSGTTLVRKFEWELNEM